MIANSLRYNAFLAYCCFAVPYNATLKYYSGHGIATNRCNSKKIRLKGWILYSFLWWLPFVVSAIIGPLYCTYFAVENLLKTMLFIANVTPRVFKLIRENIVEQWQILTTNLSDLMEASKELSFDLFDCIKDFFCMLKEAMPQSQRPQRERQDQNERPWRHAILITRLCNSMKGCWQTLHEANNEINRIQERENQSIRRRKK